jgi:hypothetical protein
MTFYPKPLDVIVAFFRVALEKHERFSGRVLTVAMA